MGTHLSSIGFSKLKKESDIKKYINKTLELYSDKYITMSDHNSVKVEIYKEYGEGLGLVVRGSIDDKELVVVEKCDPYIEARYITDVSYIEIEEDEESKVYFAICEEKESENDMVFYIQNVVEYIDAMENYEDKYVDSVKVVGMAVQGTVVLPILKEEREIYIDDEEMKYRKDLIKRFKQGDEEAEEVLNDKIEDAIKLLKDRLKEEDFLSVIEGYLFPIDEIDATYSFLGEIQEIEEVMNEDTGEVIYRMLLDCMNLPLEVCINKKELLGMPSIGMRLMGVCWLQGQLIFSE